MAPDPLGAELARIRDRNEERSLPSGDLRKALKALGAVLEAASCWEGHTAAYCADEARMLITRELLTEEAERA